MQQESEIFQLKFQKFKTEIKLQYQRSSLKKNFSPFEMLGWNQSDQQKSKERWQLIAKHMGASVALLDHADLSKLRMLESGLTYFDHIEEEYVQIYGACWDDFDVKLHNESAISVKIQKDINRTFGLFSKHSKLTAFLFSLKRGWTRIEHFLCHVHSLTHALTH